MLVWELRLGCVLIDCEFKPNEKNRRAKFILAHRMLKKVDLNGPIQHRMVDVISHLISQSISK